MARHEIPAGPATEPIGSSTCKASLRRGTLQVVEGEDAGRTVSLETGQIVIGSAPNCDFRLCDRAVSKSHAILRATDAEFVLTDLGSTNGTLVNGTRIREVWLKPGDLVQIGHTRLRFEPRLEDVRIPPSTADGFGPLHGKSLAMRQVFGILDRVAPTDTTLLIQGETGTGKDVLARAVHEASRRRDAPFLVFDCSAVSPDLVASELFGHVEGAFTGASRAHQGVFESARGGSVLIDEIGELPLDVQPKLLRILESREIRPLGSNRSLPFDARVMAATHRDLARMVGEGRFREDLYYRLAVVRVVLPPLRERTGDLPGLCIRLARRIPGLAGEVSLSEDALAALAIHPWPGNVRELRNVLERSLALAGKTRLDAADLIVAGPELPLLPRPLDREDRTLEEVERDVIQLTMERTGGNQKEAARILGVHRNTLREKIRRLGLKDP